MTGLLACAAWARLGGAVAPEYVGTCEPGVRAEMTGSTYEACGVASAEPG